MSFVRESGAMGGPTGDLYVVVQVQEHDFFRREGDDLYCEVAVNFSTLALGGDIKVPSVDGEEPLRIPTGTDAGTVFRIRGKGVPNVSGRGRGDLHVLVQAKTPKKLTKEQKTALQNLAKVLPPDTVEIRKQGQESDDRGVFGRVKDLFG